MYYDGTGMEVNLYTFYIIGLYAIKTAVSHI
jgi:hypothetical protein